MRASPKVFWDLAWIGAAEEAGPGEDSSPHSSPAEKGCLRWGCAGGKALKGPVQTWATLEHNPVPRPILQIPDVGRANILER